MFVDVIPVSAVLYIINFANCYQNVTDLANMYSMSKSTISTILQRKDLYKEASVAKGGTQISKSRSTVLDEVERLLLVWINERQMAAYLSL